MPYVSQSPPLILEQKSQRRPIPHRRSPPCFSKDEWTKNKYQSDPPDARPNLWICPPPIRLAPKLPGPNNLPFIRKRSVRTTFRTTFTCVLCNLRATHPQLFHHNISNPAHFQCFTVNKIDLYCFFPKISSDNAINFRRHFCRKNHLYKFV